MKKQWMFSLLVVTVLAVLVYLVQRQASHPSAESTPVVQLPLPMKPDTFPVTARLTANRVGQLPTTFLLQHNDLVPMYDVPEVGVFSRRVDANTMKYATMLKHLHSNMRGLHIDLIGQLHVDDYASGYENSRAADVQMRIASFISKLHPDIVAAEGFSGDTLSDWNYVRMIANFGKLMAPNEEVATERILANMPSLHSSDFSLRLLDVDPQLRIIGAEDPDLHALNQMVLKATQGNSTPINQKIVDARSLVALSRLVDAMKREHRSYGVLVMGYYHLPQLITWQKAMGIPGNVYTAKE